MTDSATGSRETNSIARLMNRGANRNNTVLEPFYGIDGQLVPGFPRTLGAAKRLNGRCLSFLRREISSKLSHIGKTLNPLLLSLGLPVSGLVAVRKARFFNYVGLVYLG